MYIGVQADSAAAASQAAEAAKKAADATTAARNKVAAEGIISVSHYFLIIG